MTRQRGHAAFYNIKDGTVSEVDMYRNTSMFSFEQGIPHELRKIFFFVCRLYGPPPELA